MPGLDVGLEYNLLEFEFPNFAPNMISAQSLFATAEYGTEVTSGLDLYGTGGLGVMQVEYENVGKYTNADMVMGGCLGLGARYHFDAFSTFVEDRHQGAIGDAFVAGAGATGPADIYGNLLLIGAGFSI